MADRKNMQNGGNQKSHKFSKFELQIDFTVKLHNKNIHGKVQILKAVDRFSKWPTVKICRTAETKKVTNFLSSNFNLYGIPEKIKSDKEERLFRRNTENSARTEISKLSIAPPLPPSTNGKRSSRKSNTNIEKFNNSKCRRQYKLNQKRKQSITCNAIYNTYRIKVNAI